MQHHYPDVLRFFALAQVPHTVYNYFVHCSPRFSTKNPRLSARVAAETISRPPEDFKPSGVENPRRRWHTSKMMRAGIEPAQVSADYPR
jgi:hypothetical protein